MAVLQHVAEHLHVDKQQQQLGGGAHSRPAGGAAPVAVTITSVRVRDVRFGLPPGDGTDSVHSLGGHIYYGYGVTELDTSGGGSAVPLIGSGLGFTLGAGTDMVCRAIEHLAKPLVGREIEDVMADFGAGTFNQVRTALICYSSSEVHQ